MKCEKVLVRRTHWSGEDTLRSYVRRGQWTRLDPGQKRVHLILYQERTHPMLGEDSEHTSILVKRGEDSEHTLILHVKRGHTSILHCMAMGENNSIPKWLIGLKVRREENLW
jgi:hypothetical protein